MSCITENQDHIEPLYTFYNHTHISYKVERITPFIGFFSDTVSQNEKKKKLFFFYLAVLIISYIYI